MITLNPGESHNFSTRPIGMTTIIHIQPTTEVQNNVAVINDVHAAWNFALAGDAGQRHVVDIVDAKTTESVAVDVSAGAGALLTVFNEGSKPFNVWSDY